MWICLFKRLRERSRIKREVLEPSIRIELGDIPTPMIRATEPDMQGVVAARADRKRGDRFFVSLQVPRQRLVRHLAAH